MWLPLTPAYHTIQWSHDSISFHSNPQSSFAFDAIGSHVTLMWSCTVVNSHSAEFCRSPGECRRWCQDWGYLYSNSGDPVQWQSLWDCLIWEHSFRGNRGWQQHCGHGTSPQKVGRRNALFTLFSCASVPTVAYRLEQLLHFTLVYQARPSLTLQKSERGSSIEQAVNYEY